MATVADTIGRALKNRRSTNDLPDNCAAAPRRERFKTGADRRLSLAVAPTSSVMMLLTRIHGGSRSKSATTPAFIPGSQSAPAEGQFS
jgi:hypothetical protein